jgi:catechol 2,3-dioxygenase-like lactoylglutathione lyase family enzyme
MARPGIDRYDRFVPEQIRGLSSLLIDVLDRDRALAFYRDTLGLPVVDEIDDGHVTVFALGDTALVMHASTPDELDGDRPGAGHTLFLRVDDPDGWVGRLREAGFEAGGPTDEPWGRVVMTRDPDGRSIGLLRPPA